MTLDAFTYILSLANVILQMEDLKKKFALKEAQGEPMSKEAQDAAMKDMMKEQMVD